MGKLQAHFGQNTNFLVFSKFGQNTTPKKSLSKIQIAKKSLGKIQCTPNTFVKKLIVTNFLFSAAQARANGLIGNVIDLHRRHNGEDNESPEMGKCYITLKKTTNYNFRKSSPAG